MLDADGYFGKDVAARFDDPTSDRFDPDIVGETVHVPADLAGAGRVLELGNTTSIRVNVVGGTGSYRSIPFRYVWPSELGPPSWVYSASIGGVAHSCCPAGSKLGNTLSKRRAANAGSRGWCPSSRR